MKWIDYQKKLKIGFSDDRKTFFFMTKMDNHLNSIFNKRKSKITEEEYMTYCDVTGTHIRNYYRHRLFHRESDHDRLKYIIEDFHIHDRDLKSYLARYCAFINCQLNSPNKKFGAEDYKSLICQMLDESQIQYEIIRDNDGYFFFPKGVEEFDKALVVEPLRWLSGYPKAEKAWIKALHEYTNQNDQNASDIADFFRKALETFFQEFFQKDGKVIKNFIPKYGDYLKSKNVPTEIRNDLQKLLDGYDHYMDSYAKHRDATSDKVLEYLMYETGNIIRLLITL